MKVYGFNIKMTGSKYVAELMKIHHKLLGSTYN